MNNTEHLLSFGEEALKVWRRKRRAVPIVLGQNIEPVTRDLYQFVFPLLENFS